MKTNNFIKCSLALFLIGAQLSCSSSDNITPAAVAPTTAALPESLEKGYFVMTYTNARFTEKDVETGNIEASGAVKNPMQTDTIKSFSQFENYAQIAKYTKIGENAAKIDIINANGLSDPELAQKILTQAKQAAAKAHILTTEQITSQLGLYLADESNIYYLTFTSGTNGKARHEWASGTSERITENIDFTYVPYKVDSTTSTTTTATAPTTLDGAWVKVEHSGYPAHVWLYGHQGKLYRLNSPDASADAPPAKPIRISPKDLWYGDNLGRTFGLAESYTYKASGDGFNLAFSIPTMRGNMCLSGAISADGNFTHQIGHPVQVKQDSQTANCVSGSCKGYYGMDEGMNADIVTRITIYK